MPVKNTQNENTFDYSFRFNNPYDLWERFEDVRAHQAQTEKERQKIIAMYERRPYSVMRGGKPRPEPDWGIVKTSVDDYIQFYSTIALDRKVWCRIDTNIGWEKQMDVTWSDAITAAFHKFCINRWQKKELCVMSAMRDDAFFCRGITMWETPFDTYPCYVPMERVFADTNATTCASSFDILFVRHEYTAVQLYNIANDPKSADLGWNRKSIMAALRYSLDSLKKTSSSTDVVNRWREGGVPQSQRDQKIPIIFAYIKEYEKAPEGHEREGNQISLLVFPEALIALGLKVTENGRANEKDAQLLKRSNYFRFIDFYAKDFDQLSHVWSAEMEHAFYNHRSFAWQISSAARYHDKTKNSTMRAIVRGMRNWVKTGSADTRKKLQTMSPDDEVVLLNSDDEVANLTMKQDIGAALEMLRNAEASINSFSPSAFGGTQTSPKGYPITKGEAQILGSQLDDSKSGSIKITIHNNTPFILELYRRFINSTEESDTWKDFQRFRDYLKSKDIPDEAWEMDNVTISPRFNKFGGTASSNYATSKALVEATQIKPASEPERRAKRELIASVIGEPNVDDFMDQEMQFDNELFVVGQENETLDNPYTNPTNVMVSPSDNHILHIRGHIQDYMVKLKGAAQLLTQAQQDQTYQKQFLLERAADVILAQDNKGAHIAAHFAIIQRDVTKQDEVRELNKMFQSAQGQQDAIQRNVVALRESEKEQNTRQNLFDLEYQHKQRMYDLEARSKEASMNLDAAKKVSQVEGSKQAADQKQEQKLRHKEQDQQAKAAGQRQDIAAKAANSALDIQKKQIEQRLDAEKKAKASEQKAKQQTNEKATKANASGQ